MTSLTSAAEAAYSLAANEAGRLHSAFLEVEHIFLGLCQVDTLSVLRPREADDHAVRRAREIRTEAAQFARLLGDHDFDIVKARDRLRALWAEAHPFPQVFSGHRTPRCRQMFGRTEKAGPTTLARLMVLTLEETSPMLDELLSELLVARERLIPALSTLEPADAPEVEEPDRPARFGRDLTQLARAGLLRQAVGRANEIKQVARVLMQANKGNALLVGDAGVGKTAIVEALALKLVGPNLPAELADLHLIEISITALLAGTRHRGDIEERMQLLIEESKADRSLVWFIDELHMLLSGRGGAGSSELADMLKPALARGEVRLIGATTVAEYRQHIEQDRAWERRFQIVWVDEPTPEAALEMLQHLRPELEAHHGLRILPAAAERAVELSVRYLPDRRLPDKAVDVLDRACARRRLLTFSPASPGAPAVPPVIGPDDVAEVVAELTRVPAGALREEDHRLLQMEDRLEARVLGQPAAIRSVVDVIRRAKAGLRDTRLPLGIFLFLGPTGTGKTELAKALADVLFGSADSLIHLDMSEYAERHAMATLIGSPPGYIGHDEGGRLVDAVRNRPSSVVLFDEIEKAHPDVFNLFLQIFDEGRLTDARGRRASFADTVIVMTSNLGGPAPDERRIGFVREPGGEQDAGGAPDPAIEPEPQGWSRYESHVREAVGGLLRPELRSRLDKEIVFRPLSRATALAVLDKFVAELNARLKAEQVVLEIDDDVRELVVARGFSRELGARAMRRAVQELIGEPLSRRLLANEVRAGQRLRVSLSADGVQFVPEDTRIGQPD